MNVISYKGLYEQLEKKSMTRTDLVKAIGLSSATISKFAKCESLSMETLMSLCEFFDCNIGDLVSFEIKEGISNEL